MQIRGPPLKARYSQLHQYIVREALTVYQACKMKLTVLVVSPSARVGTLLHPHQIRLCDGGGCIGTSDIVYLSGQIKGTDSRARLPWEERYL